MFVLRALFWLAVVGLMVPRGPDLGLDISRARADLAAQPAQFTLIDDLRGGLAAVRPPALDPAEIQLRRYRTILQNRLDGVRAEIAAAQPRTDDPALSAMREMGFR